MFAATTLKGKVKAEMYSRYISILTSKDYLRHPTDTNHRITRASWSSLRAFKSFRSRPSTYSNTVMRLLGHFSNTDDRVERCGANNRISFGKRGREPRRRLGISESSSRGGHRRTQNQFDCMWAEKHHSARINDSGLAREYLYQNLMRHIRKKSYHKELRSY